MPLPVIASLRSQSIVTILIGPTENEMALSPNTFSVIATEMQVEQFRVGRLADVGPPTPMRFSELSVCGAAKPAAHLK
jgi:hypothetical protein